MMKFQTPQIEYPSEDYTVS